VKKKDKEEILSKKSQEYIDREMQFVVELMKCHCQYCLAKMRRILKRSMEHEHMEAVIDKLDDVINEKALCELLAIIHGDGGHYLHKHGVNKATDDAIAIITKLRERAAEISEAQNTSTNK
jgi:hypothetical protein